MTPLVSLRRAAFGYAGRAVVSGVTLDLAPGDFLAVVGGNGTGKTTLLRGIMGLLRPLEGEVLRRDGLRVGYCRQRQGIDPLFPVTPRGMVEMARHAGLPPFARPSAEDRRAVKEALEATGIVPLADRRLRELSGGERQRAIVARALALEPDLLALDEPTVDLDPPAKREILDLARRLRDERGLATLLVTHELDEALQSADRFLLLAAGRPPKLLEGSTLDGRALGEFYGAPMRIVDLGDGTRAARVVTAANGGGRR